MAATEARSAQGLSKLPRLAAGITIGVAAALLLRQGLTPFVYQASSADLAASLLF